jgi:hypothetical protein
LSRRAALILGGAVLIVLLCGHLLRDTPGYAVRNEDGSLSGDITHYVYWTRLVTLGGIQAAYSGTWPETYAVYPPITLYTYQLVGNAYRLFVDPGFDADAAQRSAFLHEGIKFVALVWHLLAGLAIVWLLLRLGASDVVAALAGALYLANPATLYDVAHWGQPDGAHSLFSVLAIGALTLGWLAPAWVAMALAALAKPQAWSLVPLLALASLPFGVMRLVRALVAGGVVALVVVSPFLLTGKLGELLSLPGTVSTVMPVVSADAHNFWWLVLSARGQDPIFVQDGARFVGPLTYRLVAAGLVGGALVLSYWLYWTRRASLAEAAALGVLGWFTFTTQAHENHLFFALPLLALAWPARRALLVPFGVLSLTLLMNMFLHDQLVLEGVGLSLDASPVETLRLANAALNVTCCAVWFGVALRRPWGAVSRWS